MKGISANFTVTNVISTAKTTCLMGTDATSTTVVNGPMDHQVTTINETTTEITMTIPEVGPMEKTAGTGMDTTLAEVVKL